MNRRRVLLLLAALMVNPIHVAQAQSLSQIPRIGFLNSGAGPFLVESLRQGLRELGYVEGKDFLMEARHAEGRYERLPELAEELVRLKVDIIVTPATGPSLSAQRATKTIPIVMAGGSDPVAAKLVSSLARPGGNITGVTTVSADLGRKRLELLTQISPKLSLVAVLWIPEAAGNRLQMKQIEVAAHALGLRLQSAVVQKPNDFESAFSSIRKAHAGALIVLGSPTFGDHRPQITDFAARSRLPAIYPNSEYADAGGLMSYGANNDDLYRRAALYVDRILRTGAKPADLPVEAPTKFELVINLKAAKQIGLTIPESVLQRADRMVQ